MELKGKTVIVTGSSRGIGEAIARMFASKGANIVLNGRKPVPEQLVDDLTASGANVMVATGDISDFQTAKDIVMKAKEHFGSVDILVNNAGITKDKLLMRMDEEDFDITYQVNLKGTFNMIRHTLPLMMKQRNGSIINITSVVGVTGNVGQANYAASKAGIIGLTKSVAREAAARGITCNAIAPGFIETEMTSVLSDSVQDQLLQQIPLKRFGSADHVASAAVFLAENSYITGHTIHVNGGMYM